MKTSFNYRIKSVNHEPKLFYSRWKAACAVSSHFHYVIALWCHSSPESRHRYFTLLLRVFSISRWHSLQASHSRVQVPQVIGVEPRPSSVENRRRCCPALRVIGHTSVFEGGAKGHCVSPVMCHIQTHTRTTHTHARTHPQTHAHTHAHNTEKENKCGHICLVQ